MGRRENERNQEWKFLGEKPERHTTRNGKYKNDPEMEIARYKEKEIGYRPGKLTSPQNTGDLDYYRFVAILITIR